jgi:guanylate kinase
MTHEEFLRTYPELIKNYQPSPEVLSRIKNLTLLMTVGATGVGKTVLMKSLGLPFVPSDITRPKRLGEVEGVDYNFRTDYENIINQIKAGEFIQVAVGPGGDFYATIASSYPDNGMATMAVVADVVPIFRELGFAQTITAFITPPSYEEWIRRMGEHHIAGDQLLGRLAEAKRSFSFALSDPQTYFVLNDDLNSAVQQTKDLLVGKKDGQLEQEARLQAQHILEILE